MTGWATSAGVRRRARSLRLEHGSASGPTAPGARVVDAVGRQVLALELPGFDDPVMIDGLVGRLLVAVTALAAALTVVGGVMALAFASGAGLVLVLVARHTAPARRIASLERQLPVALESVARRLRAGGSLAQALASAVPERPGELRTSWEVLVARVPVRGVEASLEEWTSSSSLRSVHLAGAALSLATITGGSPARAIDGVAATLRARLALADEVRALSSQARASAVVIAASPVVFGLAAAATDDRTGAFFRTPGGLTLVVAGLALDVAGWRWMSRLCRAR